MLKTHTLTGRANDMMPWCVNRNRTNRLMLSPTCGCGSCTPSASIYLPRIPLAKPWEIRLETNAFGETDKIGYKNSDSRFLSYTLASLSTILCLFKIVVGLHPPSFTLEATSTHSSRPSYSLHISRRNHWAI